MEQQPPSPSPSPKKKKNNNNMEKEKKRPPTAEEILSHYESQGLEPREASLKAVSDLQSLFFRAAASSARSSSSSNTDRKLDNIGTRLSILEMKLDSKPSIPQSFALGLASGSLLSALPHIARIWNSVKSASSSSSP